MTNPSALLPAEESPTQRRVSSRDAILDAAEATVLAHGAANLTLDAVAERARVSKGGLLYHFASKEALLQAMVDRQMGRVDLARQLALAHLPAGPGRELEACVMMAANSQMNDERRLACATVAATAHHPQMLAPVREAHRRRLDWITAGTGAAGIPFERAAVISLAVDGLCLLETLQISPYGPEERQRILADLLRLIAETAASAPPQT